MTDFRRLTDRMSASPQITPDDVREAAAKGFAAIVNNRPDGEEPGQPDGAAIETAAREAGLAYHAIPISGGQFGEDQVTALQAALISSEGPVLAFCRSGTRSTLLWSMAQADAGRDLEEIAAQAAQAGYDVSPIADMLQALSARHRG